MCFAYLQIGEVELAVIHFSTDLSSCTHFEGCSLSTLPSKMCIYSVLLYADFLIIVAVNLSLMTHARPQNTYYQLSDCMQTVQFHI